MDHPFVKMKDQIRESLIQFNISSHEKFTVSVNDPFEMYNMIPGFGRFVSIRFCSATCQSPVHRIIQLEI